MGIFGSLTIESFYNMLSKRNPQKQYSSCPNLLFPDTIVYKWTQPSSWFNGATPNHATQLRREKIVASTVMKQFCEGRDPKSVVATYLNITHDKDGCDVGETEYFDAEQLDLKFFKFITFRKRTLKILPNSIKISHKS